MADRKFKNRSTEVNSNSSPEDDRVQGNLTIADSQYSVENGDFYSTVYKYLNDILMEEDLEDKTYMVQDSLALQAAEKSFYDVLRDNDNRPPSSVPLSLEHNQNSDIPDCIFTQTSSIDSSSNSRFFAADFNCIYSPNSTLRLLPDKQFPVEFDPNCTAASNPSMPQERVKDGTRERKSYKRDERGYQEEARSSKVPVVCSEESEQLIRLDNAFLCQVSNEDPFPYPPFDALRNKASKSFQQLEKPQASNLRITRLANCNQETVDLCSLLIQCAQAVGSGDQSLAIEQLKLIRQHSSPFGNGNQRLAHYFANGLQARLLGTENIFCAPAIGLSTSATEILKAYQLYVSICPFGKISNTFPNRTIVHVADKATSLHIIHFGINYGFQWPCLIHRVSTRPGGPPKIRITGIELPQPGLRPLERVEETGRRLKRLAKRLNVPFEYNAIAQKWETIRYEDLKINRDDVIAVICMYRLGNLPDDTLVLNSPRDAVLKLIKQINPDIFIHGVVNGFYNAPFFITRFREALFHFSTFFDIFETNTPREDPDRLVFERDMVGKDTMNVIACEGAARVQRPETYKQWQARNSRIGFRQMPLHQGIMRRIRIIKSDFHKDFIVDTDGNWLLLGWKGRTIHAISAWKPVQD